MAPQESSPRQLAFSATTHCLTGCATGEIAGMTIGTAAGWSDPMTIAVAVALAFTFGYGLTMLPLIRAGMNFRSAVGTALASDTVSIVIMEAIDNGAMLIVPGAMEAGLDNVLFWGTLLGGLAVAFPVAFAVNVYLISNGIARHHADGMH